MVMSTGNFPQNLRPGINQWFGNAYKIYDTKYDKILDVKEADSRAYEEDVMMSALGLPQVKTQGAPTQYDAGAQMFTTRYPHIQYSLGFVITEEMMEDGVALKMGQAFSENLKLNMLRGREIIAAGVYINGFNSSIKMDGGDNVQLYSSAHPTPAGNFSNVPASASTLSEASMEQATIDVMNYVDNRGIIIACKPDKLVVPLALQFTAHRIVNSILRPGTSNNDPNAIREMGFFPGGIIMNPYLTSATNWFVKTDQQGLNFFNRKDITLSDDNDFDTNNMKVKGLMRMSVGWSDPRSTYGVNA